MEQEKEWDLTKEETGRDQSPDQPENAPAADSPAEEKPEPEGDAPEPVTADENAASKPASYEEDGEPVQKRIKRASRKELLELVHRKNTMLQELDKEVKKTKQDLIAKEDRLLRLAAEFENYRKRTRREWELLQKTANADLIKEIVGGIDNFDRAFANLGGADSQIEEGIRLIHVGLMDVLKKAGLGEIEALNRKFDPLFHEAVGEIESEIEEGHVAQVIQRGYMLNDQVMRPARVIVSRKKGQPVSG